MTEKQLSDDDKFRIQKRILQGPKYKVFEHVAAEFAAVWYEVGRGQGLTSKWKDARSYARANFEKFIPKAIEHCVELLSMQHIPDLAKAEIYDALMERVNNPDVGTLPDVDIRKVMANLPKQERIPNAITTSNDKLMSKLKSNPFLKVN